jgi:hypothetical protein
MSKSGWPLRGSALALVCSALSGCGESGSGATEPHHEDAGTDSGADAGADSAIELDATTDVSDGASDGDADAESLPLLCEEDYEPLAPQPEAGITKVDLHTFGFEEDFEGSEIMLEGADKVRMRAINVGCRFVLTPGKYTVRTQVTDMVFPPVEVQIPADPVVTLVVYRRGDEARAASHAPDLTPPGTGNWRITFFNVTEDNFEKPVDIYYYPGLPPDPPLVAEAVPLALGVAPNTAASVVVPENTYYLDVEPTGQLTPNLTASIIPCGPDPGLDCVWSYTLACDSGELGGGGYCENRIGGPGSGFSLTPPSD